MVLEFNCPKCGNSNPKKAFEYEGSLGYEAVICKCCAAFADCNDWHDPNQWSRLQVGTLEPIEEVEDKISLYQKAENLWQTLAAIKLQAAAGFAPDPNVLNNVLIQNRL